MKYSAAFFDVDRTLIPGHSMERVFMPFLWKAGYLRSADFGRYLTFIAKNLDKNLRDLLYHNKLHFRDKDSEELKHLAETCFKTKILPLISPKGRQAVEKHQKKGRMVVILTGSLHPLAESLRKELDADITLATRLGEAQGVLTGKLANTRPYGPEKARLVRNTAAELNLDLANSFAYGDHHSDVEVLASVGYPRAVNPHPRLKFEARKRGWPIVQF
jgi:HAD superfamily hydrolase (TIGR01490 family)